MEIWKISEICRSQFSPSPETGDPICGIFGGKRSPQEDRGASDARRGELTVQEKMLQLTAFKK